MSKYAALPYIAAGEQDLFETDDLPESDQTLQQPVTDAAVEIIPSGTVEAFQKFASEDNRITQSEIASNESYESKLQRLKLELEELEQASKAQSETNLNLTEFQELVHKLSNLSDVYSTSQYDQVEIAEELELAQSSNEGKDQQPLLKYELYSRANKEEAKLMSKLNGVDQRINKIENLLGAAQAPNFLKDQAIMPVLMQLRNKVLQLDSSSLDKLDARLNVILEKIKRISEMEPSLEEIEKENKLNELYEHYVRTNKNRESILNTLERLQVLNNIQEQASQFSSTLSSLKVVQDEIQTSVDKSSKSLKEIQGDFQTISSEFKNLLSDFSQRLEKLKSKA